MLFNKPVIFGQVCPSLSLSLLPSFFFKKKERKRLFEVLSFFCHSELPYLLVYIRPASFACLQLFFFYWNCEKLLTFFYPDRLRPLPIGRVCVGANLKSVGMYFNMHFITGIKEGYLETWKLTSLNQVRVMHEEKNRSYGQPSSPRL